MPYVTDKMFVLTFIVCLVVVVSSVDVNSAEQCMKIRKDQCPLQDNSWINLFPSYEEIEALVLESDLMEYYEVYGPCIFTDSFDELQNLQYKLVNLVELLVENVDLFGQIVSNNTNSTEIDEDDMELNYMFYSHLHNYLTKHFLVHENHCDKLILVLQYSYLEMLRLSQIPKHELLSYLIDEVENPEFVVNHFEFVGDKFDDWKTFNYLTNTTTII
ncbi:hypothetical protein [Carp edema virus]|nr:hypothetical protein [Carp edema virus]